MLQQTRVETVISYWHKWMERFPNVQVLASATPEEVNTIWAGLGYYRRAQSLLKGLLPNHLSLFTHSLTHSFTHSFTDSFFEYLKELKKYAVTTTE